MAVNPNTNFTTGQVATSDQMNRFPRGVMAYDEATTALGTFSSETLAITGSSFTAVANRYYRVTFFEPDPYNTTSTTYMTFRLRLTNITGTLKQTGYVQFSGLGSNEMSALVWVGTLPAGTTNFVGTLGTNSGSVSASRTSETIAFLLVEDIGPA
jgi:hypothetical protein